MPADDAFDLIRRADVLINAKRHEEALEFALRAIAQQPDRTSGYCTASRALFGAGKGSEAAEFAERALAIDPNSALAFRLQSLGLSMWGQKLGEKAGKAFQLRAIEAAQAAIRLQPNISSGYTVLASAASWADEFEIVDSAIQKAIELAPANANVWVTASVVAMRKKDWPATVDAAQRALAINPENFAALNNLGVALRRLGKHRQSARALSEAARLNPQSSVVRRNISMAGFAYVRFGLMILLLPLVFLNAGLLLYWALAIGSNVYISKRPQTVMQFERWAAPLMLRFGSRTKLRSGKRQGAEKNSGTAWSSSQRKYRISTRILVCASLVPLVISVLSFIEVTRIPAPRQRSALLFGFVALVCTIPLVIVLLRRRRFGR